jgi:SAM-dependent methyltransferase
MGCHCLFAPGIDRQRRHLQKTVFLRLFKIFFPGKFHDQSCTQFSLLQEALSVLSAALFIFYRQTEIDIFIFKKKKYKMNPFSGLKAILKGGIKRVPVLRKPAYLLYHFFTGPFKGSERYWEQRYARGGHSGPGSAGHLAAYKAEILNTFVKTNKIKTVLEYGCGEGKQLELACYPNYTGFDVSPSAIGLCKEKFKANKSMVFKLMSEYNGERAELTLSLDVIYHLVEDEIFHRYMERLFSSSHGYVIIYSSNTDKNVKDQPRHVKHRKFTKWVECHAPTWELIQHIPNKYLYKSPDGTGSFADFYIYKKRTASHNVTD